MTHTGQSRVRIITAKENKRALVAVQQQQDRGTAGQRDNRREAGSSICSRKKRVLDLSRNPSCSPGSKARSCGPRCSVPPPSPTTLVL